jgi:hypothetical protein
MNYEEIIKKFGDIETRINKINETIESVVKENNELKRVIRSVYEQNVKLLKRQCPKRAVPKRCKLWKTQTPLK